MISAGTQCQLEIVLLGNHVQVNNEQRACGAITEELVSDHSSKCGIYRPTHSSKCGIYRPHILVNVAYTDLHILVNVPYTDLHSSKCTIYRPTF